MQTTICITLHTNFCILVLLSFFLTAYLFVLFSVNLCVSVSVSHLTLFLLVCVSLCLCYHHYILEHIADAPTHPHNHHLQHRNLLTLASTEHRAHSILTATASNHLPSSWPIIICPLSWLTPQTLPPALKQCTPYQLQPLPTLHSPPALPNPAQHSPLSTSCNH